MFQKLIDNLEYILTRINVVLVLLLLTSLFIEVLNRYLFGISWPMLQFIIPFCFLWLCMLGAAVAVRRNQHFEVDFLGNLLKGRSQKFHSVAITLSVLVASAIFCWASIEFVGLGFLKKNSATGIQMVYIYSSLLAGGALMMLMAADRLFASDDTSLIDEKGG